MLQASMFFLPWWVTIYQPFFHSKFTEIVHSQIILPKDILFT